LADGARVAFLDRPSAEAATGMYAVPIAEPLTPPTLLTEKLGPFSRDLSYSLDLLGGQTFVERLSDGTKFPINNGGRSLSFSPDATRIVWTVGQDAGNFDVRRNEIWLANMDGSDAQRVATRYGGGVVAWFNGSSRMLISGKANRNDPAPTLAILNLTEGDTQPVFSADRMRGFALAPDDRHIVFFIAQSREESMNGMYLLALDVPNAQPQRLDFFGAYQWRDANHLLYIPLKLDLPSHELWQLDVTSGQSELLIPASAESPFRVGNGDWDVSSDGKHLVYVSARDRNLWLATLP
jgi:Tol biopolymer transport system component